MTPQIDIIQDSIYNLLLVFAKIMSTTDDGNQAQTDKASSSIPIGKRKNACMIQKAYFKIIITQIK